MIYTSIDRNGEDREEGAWKRQKCENQVSTIRGVAGNQKKPAGDINGEETLCIRTQIPITMTKKWIMHVLLYI